MDREYIAQRLRSIQSKENLLNLLNEIKYDILGEKAYPISMRQLNYYANPNRSVCRYVTFSIPKSNGGQRKINAPVSGLKSILTYLNVALESVYEPHPAANGFVRGKSVVDNAKVHVDANYVFNIDLKDFFTSVHQARVWKRLQIPPFSFSQELASTIAGLCCVKMIDEDESRITFVLPQGAPTSPIITNIICDRMDRRLTGLAKRFGLNYSRYADDISFSSNHYVYHPEGEFCTELRRIIEDQNFSINTSKTRLLKKGDRQEVTGLVVNNKVNVTREYVRELRSLLYVWEKYGYSVAMKIYDERISSDSKLIRKKVPNLDTVLRGKIQYLKMVKGKEDACYLQFYERFNSLIENGLFYRSKKSNLKYIESQSVTDFETKMKVKIEFYKSSVGYKFAYFRLNGKLNNISFSKQALNIEKDKLFVSLCEDNGSRFYLLHKPYYTNNNTMRQVTSKNNLDEALDMFISSEFDLNKILLWHKKNNN